MPVIDVISNIYLLVGVILIRFYGRRVFDLRTPIPRLLSTASDRMLVVIERSFAVGASHGNRKCDTNSANSSLCLSLSIFFFFFFFFFLPPCCVVNFQDSLILTFLSLSSSSFVYLQIVQVTTAQPRCTDYKEISKSNRGKLYPCMHTRHVSARYFDI